MDGIGVEKVGKTPFHIHTGATFGGGDVGPCDEAIRDQRSNQLPVAEGEKSLTSGRMADYVFRLDQRVINPAMTDGY